MFNQGGVNNVILIKQEGCFYSVSNNDALIFNKYLGYKLYGKKKIKTGFHINKLEIVLEKIDKIGMDYDIIDKKGNIVASKRFPFGVYEVIDTNICSPNTNMKNENNEAKISIGFKEKYEYYKNILKGLSNGCNAFTGELILGIDEELKNACLEMSKYFEDRIKSKEIKDRKIPNHNKKWTKLDDELLLKEYKSGK